MMRWLVLALGLIATPAMAADKFDLVCSGHHRTSPDGKWKPYEVRYRVDLTAKVYCRFNCTGTETLASADAARIEFASSANDATDRGTVIHYVDRTDGAWKYYISGPLGLIEDAEGKCEPAPFSGFPAAKF